MIIERLTQWVINNPMRWQFAPYKEIANELGINFVSVYNLLVMVVAELHNPDRDPNGILPTMVLDIRRAHRGSNIEAVRMVKNNPDMPSIDIAYTTGTSVESVEKLRFFYREWNSANAKEAYSIVTRRNLCRT